MFQNNYNRQINFKKNKNTLSAIIISSICKIHIAMLRNITFYQK